MTAIGKRKVRDILDTLRDIRKVSTMDSAAFHPPGSNIGDRNWWNTEDYTQQVREATRIWRDSWIIGPLNEIIDMLEKELKK